MQIETYNFDFLTLAKEAQERDLELYLRQFLIEIGVGFAFVGDQVPLEVGGEDFKVDLLFYHGLILCKAKNRIIAEYALRNTTTTIGISEFRHLERLPKRLKGTLPTVEEIEAALAKPQEPPR